MLIHERTINELDKISQRFFWMNKKLDRMKSVLDTKFTMPILSNLIHLDLSHQYPLLADQINDIEEMFNYDAKYLGVEGATEDYEDVSDLLGQLYDWTIETNDQLNYAIQVSLEEKDMNVYFMLQPISIEYSKYVANAILLTDKKKLYGNDLSDMDVHSKEWWKL